MKIQLYFSKQTEAGELLETSTGTVEMTGYKFCRMLPGVKKNGMLHQGKIFHFDHVKMGWDPDTLEPQTALYFFIEMEAEEFEKEKRTQKKPGESI